MPVVEIGDAYFWRPSPEKELAGGGLRCESQDCACQPAGLAAQELGGLSFGDSQRDNVPSGSIIVPAPRQP